MMDGNVYIFIYDNFRFLRLGGDVTKGRGVLEEGVYGNEGWVAET